MNNIGVPPTIPDPGFVRSNPPTPSSPRAIPFPAQGMDLPQTDEALDPDRVSRPERAPSNPPSPRAFIQ